MASGVETPKRGIGLKEGIDPPRRANIQDDFEKANEIFENNMNDVQLEKDKNIKIHEKRLDDTIIKWMIDVMENYQNKGHC